MAETEKPNKRPRSTPEEFAVRFNSGAAYASATGDLLGGMGYVFHQSRDLSTEPIIQNVMAGAQVYLVAQKEYAQKMGEWEQSEDENKGDRPNFEMTQQMALAQNHYQELHKSSDMRTQMFNEGYAALTVDQAKNNTLYGKTLKDVPEEITNLIAENRDKKVGEVDQEGKLGKSLEAFKRYHVLGNTAQRVQSMYLGNTLEDLAQSK